jgi:hypothetical protein
MAFQTPQNTPLTETQKELTSKIGSIKNLLSIPNRSGKNIPKSQQISTFDYLLKILRVLGFPPEPLFRLFIEQVFSPVETFLEEKVLQAIGDGLDAQGITLQQGRDNGDVLRGAIPATFLQTVKQSMAKELTYMIFGGRPDSQKTASLVDNPARAAVLIEQAVCGSNMFSLSNNPAETNQDIEFNRVSLAEQLEAGEVIFEISCQEVKIKLPEEPGIFFGEGGTEVQQSSTITPAKSLDLVVNFVADQTSAINNQDNAESAGKSFFEIMIGKLLSYITTLVLPHLGAPFAWINANGYPNVTPESVAYNNCSISPSSSPSTKAFSTSLMNALYLTLLKIMLLFIIRQFKKLVKNYFAKAASERAKRKSEKIKMKFNLLGGIADAASKAAKFKAALASLGGILNS